MKKRWTLLFSVLLGIFSCVSVSRASARQVEVLNGAVGESVTFSTRVPVTGSITYEGNNIGLVINKQTDTDSDEKFKNRLSWSSEFFTLSDLRSDDSGVYIVESTREEKAKQVYQLIVYDKVSTPRVITLNPYSPESDLCLLQCSVRNVRGLNLSWFRGNVQLNQTSSSNSSSPETTLILPLEIQQIDKDIFSCEASNPVSKQNITVNFTELCLQKPGIFSCVSVSRASARQVEVLNGAVGESVTFSTRVPTSGTITYKDRTIGQVLNKQTEINEKFKNRLSWISEFFTLSDLRSDDSGVYSVESYREVETKQSYQLNVFDKVSTPRVITLNPYSPESDLCLLQCSVRNVRGLNLSWFRGNILLNKTSSFNSSSINTTLNLPLEIQQIDKDIFSCEASNPVSKQSITVNFAKLCPHKLDKITDDNRSYIILVIITVIPVVLSLAVIVMITFKERRKQETSRSLKGSNGIYQPARRKRAD
ncbi:titin [Astyanax mexicanus]|uniref:titin n=1 Tax=Astyanax mexicanus TaxID=7994 RepID=UPI0020CADFC3|nr:titin [Astyanax mexicanus]